MDVDIPRNGYVDCFGVGYNSAEEMFDMPREVIEGYDDEYDYDEDFDLTEESSNCPNRRKKCRHKDTFDDKDDWAAWHTDD